MNDAMTYEDYLRSQASQSQYGVTIIQTQIALDIADWIEKNRQRTHVIKCKECPFAPWDYWRHGISEEDWCSYGEWEEK